jgi:hypothetical protein
MAEHGVRTPGDESVLDINRLNAYHDYYLRATSDIADNVPRRALRFELFFLCALHVRSSQGSFPRRYTGLS